MASAVLRFRDVKVGARFRYMTFEYKKVGLEYAQVIQDSDDPSDILFDGSEICYLQIDPKDYQPQRKESRNVNFVC